MKKFAFAAAVMALLTVFAVSCKKDKKDKIDTTPTVTWDANGNFATCEITDKMEASVSITATEGIQDMTIKFTKIPVTLVGLVNQHIAVSDNRATSKNNNLATLDLINDSSVAAWFKELNITVPATIKGSTGCTINFKTLIGNLMSNQELENDETISFTLSITDKEDQNVTKSLSFHYTEGPEITVKNQAFTLAVPGKIEKAALVVSSASTSLNNKLSGSVYDGVKVNDGIQLDLIENSTAAGKLAGYGLSTGSKLKGLTKATLDLTKFINEVVLDEIKTDKSVGTHSFTLTIEDANGKVANGTAQYEYSE